MIHALIDGARDPRCPPVRRDAAVPRTRAREHPRRRRRARPPSGGPGCSRRLGRAPQTRVRYHASRRLPGHL